MHNLAHRTLIFASSASTFLIACAPPAFETCFCGGEMAQRFEAMEASGTVIDSLKDGVVRNAEEGVCVCVPAVQLETVTRNRLGALRKALEGHYVKDRAFPETLDRLVGAAGVTADTITDAWFKPFAYEVLGLQEFKLCSGFGDGVLGTDDDVCDDTSRK